MKIEHHQKNNINISKFIYMTDKTYLPELLGSHYENIIQKLYIQKNNLYSYKNTLTVCEVDKILGICWYYDSRKNNILSTITWLSILLYQPLIAYRMLLTKRNQLTVNLSDNGIYILVIATDEKYRSHGIGQMMISEIERIARIKMKKYIELDVESVNIIAINFYIRNEFKVFNTHEFIQGNRKSIYFRMRKAL